MIYLLEKLSFANGIFKQRYQLFSQFSHVNSSSYPVSIRYYLSNAFITQHGNELKQRADIIAYDLNIFTQVSDLELAIKFIA